MAKQKYYTVWEWRNTGIFESWEECNAATATKAEAAVIRTEAKRLHLTVEEVNALIEVVIKEHELEERNPLPIHKIAENPALAVEHYKVLLGQIRQLGVQVNAAQFDQAAQQGDRLSANEFALWQKIQGKA